MTNRRDFFRLAGGAIWVTACASRPGGPREPRASNGLLLAQLTDTHWGYSGAANPDPKGAIERALAEIAAWPEKPSLLVHTGDVSQMTTDAAQRRTRLTEAKRAFEALGIPVHAIPGEHDASLDGGAAFREVFGPTRWSMAIGGTHLIALDNVSDPKGVLGDEQLAWLDAETSKVPAGAPLLVFVHRPLFPLAQAWDWFTADGERAIAILEKRGGATVFYGHIHQVNVARTGSVTHVSARPLVFPLPPPMSQPQKAPVPWDPAAIDHGLGWRGIVVEGRAPVWVERALVG